MEAMNHLQRLKFFKEGNPYLLLESLDYLRKRNYLPPLWLAFENNFIREWESTDLFKEWVWKSDDETLTLFDIWSKKLHETEIPLDELKGIVKQSELLEDQLNGILSLQEPPTQAMIEELDTKHGIIKKKLLERLYDELF